MAKSQWKPWHEVVELRDDVRTGELSLATFAADLYAVVTGNAKPVYQDPEQFFSLTYPTYNLRELAKDVVARLSGKSEKAVRQLMLTYGGGKTHALITLYHLVSDPEHLPDVPAVQDFVKHVGATPPKTRVAVLSFDKLDVEKGMETRAPDGSRRWLVYPWSVLAYEVAGDEGLKLLHAKGKAEERETPPAENLLHELLSLPSRQGLPVLILMDEVLMYARERVRKDPDWRNVLESFFQYLTQAVTKVDHCAMIVSLLATDPKKGDDIGKTIVRDLQAVLSREREEGIQPVVKDDVAEVLRRRFFTRKSIAKIDEFRPNVVAALKGITALDEQTQREGPRAEKRYLESYPFHPDLIEVLYTKWTQLNQFQQTRGVLRTFALALRDSEKWDTAPLIGPNVFLNAPTKPNVSEAMRELTSVADTQSSEGLKHNWSAVLETELSKVQAIQQEMGSFKHRELEQAVAAVFIHSQPVGQKAHTSSLYALLGATDPDSIELGEALKTWAERSWHLDEEMFSDIETAADGTKTLPKTWRLGPSPNLRQMHDAACDAIAPETVEAHLLDEVRKVNDLVAGASAVGVRSHRLPERPSEVEDDGEFHYVVLGPKAASESGKPSPLAKKFIDEKTSADNPRVNRNAIVLLVPSKDGIDLARDNVRSYLGWLDVQSQVEGKLEAVKQVRLRMAIDEVKARLLFAIKQSYCIVVTVSEKNEVHAFKLAVENKPHFQLVKNDKRTRIQDSPISAEALLPGGPYDLWKKGETARRVKDLVGAFAMFPHLPKMLQPKQVFDTLILGAKQGFFVLRVTRPDKTFRTFWHAEPDAAALEDKTLELVLSEAASLSYIPPELLAPQALPGLWAKPEIKVTDVLAYFAGGTRVKVKREGYEETQVVPKAERPVVETAVAEAVKLGYVWMLSGPASVWKEEVPQGVLNEEALLLPPPPPIPVMDLLPEKLAEAWKENQTTGLALITALSHRAGRTLPWTLVCDAVTSALQVRVLELMAGSGAWPCGLSGAGDVRLRVPVDVAVPPVPPRPGVLVAEAELTPAEIQDLADVVGDVVKAAGGHPTHFKMRFEVEGVKPGDDVVKKLNELLRKISQGWKLG